MLHTMTTNCVDMKMILNVEQRLPQLLHTTGAAERWLEDQGDLSYRDDISVFVIYLAEPNGAGSGTTTVFRQ